MTSPTAAVAVVSCSGVMMPSISALVSTAHRVRISTSATGNPMSSTTTDIGTRCATAEIQSIRSSFTPASQASEIRRRMCGSRARILAGATDGMTSVR
ncbi:hypothetical protein [Gordonia jinghuaiqii]|uniref:hypothetical protein n=1 Tax=Gordonia jinghuaiqii TaxID=2758710 RepID=UPI002948BB9A|nr:hypothetical protein [Gordonia jinghuaiqii]